MALYKVSTRLRIAALALVCGNKLGRGKHHLIVIPGHRTKLYRQLFRSSDKRLSLHICLFGRQCTTMGKFNVTAMRYLESEHFRVLLAVR